MIKARLILLVTFLFFNSFVFANDLSELRTKAENGDASAQYNLALKFYNGEGVTQDYKQAVYWYTKSAEQGDASAQNNLGFMFANGQGVIQDYVQAHKWWNISAFEGFLAAASGGADARKNRDLVENKMTKEQVAEAQRLASEWMEAY